MLKKNISWKIIFRDELVSFFFWLGFGVGWGVFSDLEISLIVITIGYSNSVLIKTIGFLSQFELDFLMRSSMHTYYLLSIIE